jgi:4-hydroxybenzoate polyprenyltransferase
MGSSTERRATLVDDSVKGVGMWGNGFIPRKLRAYLELIRPFTLLAPLFGGITGGIMGLAADPRPGYADRLVGPDVSFSAWPFFQWEFPLIELLWGAVVLMLVNAGSNVLNQVYDDKIDSVNKPGRPIPSGTITHEEGLTLAWLLYFIAFFRAALTLNGPYFLLILVLIGMTYAYSVPPLRLKERLWTSNISIALARGMFGFTAAWCIFGNPFNPLPWVIGSIMAIFLVGAMTTKDFTDVEGDRLYGARTLPVVYGLERSIALSAPFFVLPFAIIPLAVNFGLLPASASVLTLLSVWGVYVVMLLFREKDTHDEIFENSPAWKHMYLMLMAMQIGFCMVVIGDVTGFGLRI